MEAIKNTLLSARQWLKRIYAGYGVYINILIKWAAAYASLTALNEYFPGRSFLLRPIVVIAISLLCSVLPWSYITLISGIWLLLQLSALSLEATVYMFLILLVLALLRYLLLPGVGIALVLLPLFFLWKIPFVIPVMVGLIGTASGFITVGSGVVIFYCLQMIVRNMSYFTDPEAATLVQRLLFLTEHTIQNNMMLAVLIAFCLTTLTVYLISRISVPYSPQIAVLIGAALNPLLLRSVLRFFELSSGPESMVWGSVAAFFTGLLFSVFVRFLDYGGTEHVQFEDDEYYYYVKAVPKLLQPGGADAADRQAVRNGKSRAEKAADMAAAREAAPDRRSRGNADRRSRIALENAGLKTAEAEKETEEVTENA